MNHNVIGQNALKPREALANLLDALAVAENASRQMAITREESQWVLVAEQMHKMRQICSTMGQRSYGLIT